MLHFLTPNLSGPDVKLKGEGWKKKFKITTRDVCSVSFAEEARAVRHRAGCKYQMKYPLWNHAAALPEKAD